MKNWLNIAIAVIFVLAPVQAFAHDHWSDGEPVPAWVKSECCGIADAHHLRPDQVHVVDGGYKIDGYKSVIPYSTMKPSPDGEYWAFYRQDTDGWQSPVYCFFGPSMGT